MNTNKRDFQKLMDKLAYGKNRSQVFRDFILTAGLSMAQAVCFSEDREQQYMEIVKRYKKAELHDLAELLSLVVDALDENPSLDFLGEIWMEEGFGDNKKGQYFTPYTIAEMNARITLGNAVAQIKEERWISVSDSACGSGIMLIAAANVLRSMGVNYQRDVVFVGQELDPVIAYMGYIQMSLLGLPGFVRIGNSLSEPMTNHPLFPDKEDLITPLFLLEPWPTRRVLHKLNNILKTNN